MPPLPVTAKQRRRTRRYKRIGALAVIATFVFALTRSVFLNTLLLPRIEKKLGIEFISGALNYSPKNGFRLSNLVAKGRDSDEVFLKAQEARIQLNYFAAFYGAKRIPKLNLIEPELQLTQQRHGDLSPHSFITSRVVRQFSANDQDFGINRLTLTKARLVLTQQAAKDVSRVFDIKKLDLELTQPKGSTNGVLKAHGEWEVSALQNSKMESAPQLLGKTRGVVSSELTFSKMRHGPIDSLQLSTTALAQNGEGVFEEMSQDQLSLSYDYANNRIKSANLEWSRRDAPLIDAYVSQTNPEPNSENRMQIGVTSRDFGFLDLWIRPLGLKMSGEQLNIEAEWFLNNAKTRSILQGTLRADKITTRSSRGTTPPVDVSLVLNILNDQLEETLLLNKECKLDIQQSDVSVFSINLERQLNIAYGDTFPNYKPATAMATLSGFDLSAWTPLFPHQIRPFGTLNGSLSLSSSEDARRINATGQLSGKNLQFEFDRNGQATLSNTADLSLSGTGRILDFERFSLDDLTTELWESEADSSFASGSIRLERDRVLKSMRTSANFKARLPSLSRWLNSNSFDCSQGALDISLELDQDQTSSAYDIELIASRFTGSLLGRDLSNVSVELNPQFSTDDNTIKLNRMTLNTRHDATNGIDLSMNGESLKSGARGRARIDIDLVNEAFIEDIAPRVWEAMTLQSIQLNGNIEIAKDRNTNLRVSPSIHFSAKPRPWADVSSVPPGLNGSFNSLLEHSPNGGWLVSSAELAVSPKERAGHNVFSLSAPITFERATSESKPQPMIEADDVDAERLGPFLAYLAESNSEPLDWLNESPLEITLRIGKTVYEDRSVQDWENHFAIANFPSISQIASQLLPQDISYRSIRSKDLWSPYSTISNKTLNNPSND